MKNKLMLSLAVLMVAVSVLAVSAQDVATDDGVVSQSVSDDVLSQSVSDDDAVYQAGENSGNKEVWIDQSVDNSMVYINGELRIIDSSGSTLLVLPLSNSTSSKFSTVDSDARNLETQTVDNAINYAKKLLNLKSIKIVQGTSTNTTKVYDHRKYETQYDNDAALIGDADYLEGAYGISTTVTHLVLGDYARIMNLTLKYVAEAVENEDAPVVDNPTVNNTTNTTSNATSNTNVTNVNSNDNVTNNTHIKPKDVAKATGIPFAVLIVSLLGIGVSIRRRK